MRTTVIEALAACLEAIEGGTSPKEALARQPELRRELKPLVTAALAVHRLPPQAVRPAFRHRTRAFVA